jgi:hypothetical protein
MGINPYVITWTCRTPSIITHNYFSKTEVDQNQQEVSAHWLALSSGEPSPEYLQEEQHKEAKPDGVRGTPHPSSERVALREKWTSATQTLLRLKIGMESS